MDRLPSIGSDFLSVIRGHDGVSLRGVVKRSSEVHRCALLSEGTGKVVCSIISCGDQQIGWDISNKNIHLSLESLVVIMYTRGGV